MDALLTEIRRPNSMRQCRSCTIYGHGAENCKRNKLFIYSARSQHEMKDCAQNLANAATTPMVNGAVFKCLSCHLNKLPYRPITPPTTRISNVPFTYTLCYCMESNGLHSPCGRHPELGRPKNARYHPEHRLNRD